jgi:competence protein ComGC
MSEKNEVTQTENGTAPRSKNRTCARHCKRFWWVYLIILCVIVVIVVPVIILVAVPKIAQSKINEAELEIQNTRILETEGNAYLMEIDSTITTDGKIHAKVDPFEAEMYLEDWPAHKAFATVDMPETNSNKHQVVNVSQHVKIADMEEFTRFNVWFHNNETLRVTVYGKTKVQPKGLSRKYGVTFKKTVELKGLNHFAGTTVNDGHIGFGDGKDEPNFNGTTTIPNASVFTLDNGNVTFRNFVGDVEVGTLTIPNLVLKPGDNVVNITANMNQTLILNAVQEEPYCKTGILPFKLLGKSVVNHGENLTYFAAALGSSNQTVDIDIGAILKKSIKYTVKCKSDKD